MGMDRHIICRILHMSACTLCFTALQLWCSIVRQQQCIWGYLVLIFMQHMGRLASSRFIGVQQYPPLCPSNSK